MGDIDLLAGLVCALVIGPRKTVKVNSEGPPMASPTTAILGLFMLWWGWLGFNCGR